MKAWQVFSAFALALVATAPYSEDPFFFLDLALLPLPPLEVEALALPRPLPRPPPPEPPAPPVPPDPPPPPWTDFRAWARSALVIDSDSSVPWVSTFLGLVPVKGYWVRLRRKTQSPKNIAHLLKRV